MDSGKELRQEKSEGYLSLAIGMLCFTSLIGLFFYFIQVAPNAVPDSELEQVVETILEDVVEQVLVLPENSVTIDLSPESKETENDKGDEKA